MENLPTILTVDDNESNIEILSASLKNRYNILVANDGIGAIEIAKDKRVDLILLDTIMPEIDGYEVCKRLKQNPSTKDIPVIFLISNLDEESIERAYDVGGVDYISKPLKPKELLAKVTREVKIQALIEELKSSYSRLEELAQTDSLTKLYNRRFFSNISRSILKLSKREKKALSLVMVDIDEFKNINDTYGYKVGDEVIIHLANLLESSKRDSDIICRYGEDKFLILLPNTPLDGAINLANKLKEKVEKELFSIGEEITIDYTVSLGIANIDLERETSIEKAIKRAEEALYQSKSRGKNRINHLEEI